MKLKKKDTQPLIFLILLGLTMRRSTPLPTQLRNIIQTEGKAQNIKTCLENIEKAKQNELNAYLSLCHARLNLPPQ